MPEHYADWWWEDLPERAKKAAAVLGYDKKLWDADSHVPYDDKKFEECTFAEKRAARYLSMDPIDKKLDIWWSETDEETKKHAQVLGWDQHKWDHDWSIRDLPCEHVWWNDLTEEQRVAGHYFGYTKASWDETGEDDDEDFDAPPPASAPAPASAPEEAEEEEEEEEEEEGAEEKPKKKKPLKKKAAFSVSRMFGGEGGDEFDHRNHKAIHKISIKTDGHIVQHISMDYIPSTNKSVGKDHGREQSMTLEKGEYVVSVTVRSNKLVQSLGFTTNKGNTLGPVGGKGWILPGKDHAGEEVTVRAPIGCQLCGLKGRAGSCLDAIAFRWGPIPGQK